MAYLLFFIYLLLLCWLLIKIPFVKKTGLKPSVILILFVIKILAGLALGWFTHDIVNDYWPLNADSINEYKLLLQNPSGYLDVLFHSTYEKGYGGFLDALPSYWNDLQITLIGKTLALFNFLTNGNYYINSLFFNFFCFLGHVAFYRVYSQVYITKNTAVLICCFLLPSTLYFSSGIHKDGIVFTALGFLFYAVHQSLQKQEFNFKRTAVILFAFTALFFVRSYVVLLVTPALLLWILVYRYKLPVIKTFFIGYAAAGILFFGLRFSTGGFNPLEAVTKKQEAFFMLDKAATQVPLDTLQPNFASFAKNAPQAFNHSFLRPHITELHIHNLLPIIIETLIYHIAFIVFLFRRQKSYQTKNLPLLLAGVFFGITLFLFIGYIVPNLGSIVRYRSIYLIFIITPVFAGIDCGKFINPLKIKKY